MDFSVEEQVQEMVQTLPDIQDPDHPTGVAEPAYMARWTCQRAHPYLHDRSDHAQWVDV